MKILCDVNLSKCLRRGFDAPSNIVTIEIDPKALSQDERDFIADQLYNGVRFPKTREYEICPATHEGFMDAVTRGIQQAKRQRERV
jgi:hypothetical protein